MLQFQTKIQFFLCCFISVANEPSTQCGTNEVETNTSLLSQTRRSKVQLEYWIDTERCRLLCFPAGVRAWLTGGGRICIWRCPSRCFGVTSWITTPSACWWAALAIRSRNSTSRWRQQRWTAWKPCSGVVNVGERRSVVRWCHSSSLNNDVRHWKVCLRNTCDIWRHLRKSEATTSQLDTGIWCGPRCHHRPMEPAQISPAIMPRIWQKSRGYETLTFQSSRSCSWTAADGLAVGGSCNLYAATSCCSSGGRVFVSCTSADVWRIRDEISGADGCGNWGVDGTSAIWSTSASSAGYLQPVSNGAVGGHGCGGGRTSLATCTAEDAATANRCPGAGDHWCLHKSATRTQVAEVLADQLPTASEGQVHVAHFSATLRQEMLQAAADRLLQELEIRFGHMGVKFGMKEGTMSTCGCRPCLWLTSMLEQETELLTCTIMSHDCFLLCV